MGVSVSESFSKLTCYFNNTGHNTFNDTVTLIIQEHRHCKMDHVSYEFLHSTECCQDEVGII